MKDSEILQIIFGILIASIVIGFNSLLDLNVSAFGIAIFSAFLIILVDYTSKKIMASKLDSGIEVKIWQFQRYGFAKRAKFKKPISAGVVFPLVITIISLGLIKPLTIFTYEASALKRRAAKRFGQYSFTEMTDWHNALIGAAGITATIILAFISYWIPGLETLSRFSAYYAFWNLLPFSRLDGAQIYFGSRVLWTALMIIAAILSIGTFIII